MSNLAGARRPLLKFLGREEVYNGRVFFARLQRESGYID